MYEDQVAYFTESGTAPNLVGTANVLGGESVAVTGNRVSRQMQANNNAYFTSDDGVLKLESETSDVFKAGVPPALDLRASFLALNGPIKGNTQVGWRCIFGRRDGNDNLLLGSPSDILTLANATVLSASWTRTSNVVTVTTSSAHNLSVGMIVSVSNSSGGSPDVAAGDYTILTVPDATSYTFAETAADDGSGNTLDYAVSRTTRLEISIPTEIDDVGDAWFVQIYRTSQTSSSAVSPPANFKLIEERQITAAEIAANLLFFDDDIDDILLGEELYTNPNSQEGELQANDRPPLCEDVTLFKGMALYGNITTRHFVEMSLVAPGDLANNDFVEVRVDATTRRYVCRTGVGNKTVTAEAVAGTGTITITYTSHGFTTGDVIRVSRISGTLTVGTYAVTVVDPDNFTITSVGESATDLDFQGLTDGTNPIFTLDNSSASVSVQLRDTAQGLVKAINRDGSSLVYARYTSGITDIPGMFRLEAKGFTGQISLRANTLTAGGAFSPALPDSFSTGTQVTSRNDDLPHTFSVSKLNEPEAVPRVNQFPVGARNKQILRVLALRDTAILLKEDGVYRVTGDSPDTISVTALDTTVITVAPSTAVVLNNQIPCLTNQGLCLVTDSSVQIISRVIEDEIQPLLGLDGIENLASGVGYESDRLYHLSMPGVNEEEVTVTWVYNVLNQSWTESDVLFKQAVVGPNDRLYFITTGGILERERKDQTKLDFTGQNYAITVDSVAADGLSAVITSSSIVPQAGWVLEKDDLISRLVLVVESVGAGKYSISFPRETNIEAADSLQLYSSYESRFILAPFHAGLVGRVKQFAEMQMHLRNSAASEFDIGFTGQFFESTQYVRWSAIGLESESGGWGSGPWGGFPWGEQDSIDLTTGTLPNTPVRIYVTPDHQRGTYLQPIVEHEQAAEPLNIQALAFAVRPYQQRVSR